MAKRILIVADFSSIHIFNYIRNVIMEGDFECVGFHFKSSDIKPEYLDLYKKASINIVDALPSKILKEKGAIKYSVLLANQLKELGEFDILHYHQIQHFLCPALFLARNNFKKIVLSYWGSDLYRRSLIEQIETLPLLSVSDEVTVITDDMKKNYRKQILNLFYNSSNLRIVDFGNMFYELMSEIKERYIDKRQLKLEMGLNPDKLVVTVGYVGRPQMQQVNCLQEILKLDFAVLNKIQLIFPAYGINSVDKSSLDRLIESSGIEARVSPEFMGPNEVSELRVATDIFIHGQTTDALSCAMLEHLYAGSVVINGEWLNYETLTNNHIYYNKFKDMNSLSSVLSDVILNFEQEREKTITNQSIVHRISSWDTLRNQWLNLYD